MSCRGAATAPSRSSPARLATPRFDQARNADEEARDLPPLVHLPNAEPLDAAQGAGVEE